MLLIAPVFPPQRAFSLRSDIPICLFVQAMQKAQLYKSKSRRLIQQEGRVKNGGKRKEHAYGQLSVIIPVDEPEESRVISMFHNLSIAQGISEVDSYLSVY